ncbi:hypothetical protein LY76DRAFT_651713 [Colletotrichum caudatum]|nr:hypothetical protein LY76DRAFT_651713 [Colletotrichum caudatum]
MEDTNEQELSFHGTRDVDIEGEPVVTHEEKPMFGDHEHLDPGHPLHRKVFWANCIYDECTKHEGKKGVHAFYPRRPNTTPIVQYHTNKDLHTWKIKEYGQQTIYFEPSPKHPVPCAKERAQKATREKKSLYFTTTSDHSDEHLVLTALINGQPTQVVIDSGAQFKATTNK